MKRKAMTWLHILVFIALCVIAVAITMPLPNRARENGRRSRCRENLKLIGLAFAQYNNDYDDKFPITTTEQGWFGALQPYLKSEAIFRCPSEELRKDDNLTDYWFNRRLAGVELKAVDYAALTFLSGDGEPSDDPNVSIQMLPPRWMEKQNSPARRHLDGANYGFADGHVKWMKFTAIAAPKQGREISAPTFLLR